MSNPVSVPQNPDSVEHTLQNIAEYCLVVTFGLLPLFFVPVTYVPLGYLKTLFVIVGLMLAVIFFSLSVLRSGSVTLRAPLALSALWGVAGISVVSAILSGDRLDALYGNVLGVHTALFLVLLAGIATVTTALQLKKASVMHLYLLLTFSAGVLTIFHVLRLFFGADFLSLGVFTSAVSTPMGGWNDLALLFGLIILLAMVALEQLPLTKWGKVIFTVTILMSLLMLAVVNFFMIWIVIGLVSLLVLMYSLTKDRLLKQQSFTSTARSSVSVSSVVLSALVFVVSLVFVIGGSTVGAAINDWTGISYVEVRPSVDATINIAREVYSENAFMGTGPNRFGDAWRLHKDPAINQTIFWDTGFGAGSGYIPTWFVTTGLFGTLFWLLFLGSLLVAGYRMLVVSATGDAFWYFIGSSSFVAAVYLWGMFLVYVPGPTIVLLAGIFTSVVFVAYSALMPGRGVKLSMLANQRSGIILVGIVMLLIVGAVSVLYLLLGRHYMAVSGFERAIASINQGTSLATVERSIAEAYQLFPNDIFARQLAQYQIAGMNTLIGLTEPTEAQQQQFQQAASKGINAAQLAVTTDPTEPQNHATLGALYSLLAAAGVEGSQERAVTSYEQAIALEPQNPLYPLLFAQLYSRTGDLETAREYALRSVNMKNNYTEALFLLTQIEIATGNVEQAIASAAAIVSLEPNNPARLYQLGVLYASLEQHDNAITVFERAVALDEGYANARYFLALSYTALGRTTDAISQLEIVRDLNEDNAVVQGLIDQLTDGGTLNLPDSTDNSIGEPNNVSADGSAVTTTRAPDTPLISPVNVVPEETESTPANDLSAESASDESEPTP